jgi:hypothetical protein
VTIQANIFGGRTPAAMNAAKTHCHRGHEFSPENTRVNANGSRSCRQCDAIKQAAYRARKRAEQLEQ